MPFDQIDGETKEIELHLSIVNSENVLMYEFIGAYLYSPKNVQWNTWQELRLKFVFLTL